MTADDIAILVDDDLSDDPIWTIALVTPIGTLGVMAEIRFDGGSLGVTNLHLSGDPGIDWGWSTLRMIDRLVVEKLDVDEIVVVGAIRTTGANPGRRPRRYRIARASQPPAAARRPA